MKEVYIEHEKLPANTTMKLSTSIDEDTLTLQTTNTTDNTIVTEKVFTNTKFNRIKINHS